ncbi:hypothetical protein GE21DRAFT_1290196, partial [Neurospora crassa]
FFPIFFPSSESTNNLCLRSKDYHQLNTNTQVSPSLFDLHLSPLPHGVDILTPSRKQTDSQHQGTDHPPPPPRWPQTIVPGGAEAMNSPSAG